MTWPNKPHAANPAAGQRCRRLSVIFSFGNNMKTYLEMRWGGGGEDPTEVELQTALAQMDKSDPEHPDCWLVDENGWSIAFHEEGRIVMENPEGDEGPWHLPKATTDTAMEIWRLLQKGEINEIRKLAWKTGYK